MKHILTLTLIVAALCGASHTQACTEPESAQESANVRTADAISDLSADDIARLLNDLELDNLALDSATPIKKTPTMWNNFIKKLQKNKFATSAVLYLISCKIYAEEAWEHLIKVLAGKKQTSEYAN